MKHPYPGWYWSVWFPVKNRLWHMPISQIQRQVHPRFRRALLDAENHYKQAETIDAQRDAAERLQDVSYDFGWSYAWRRMYDRIRYRRAIKKWFPK
jgi:hypothetical protein